MPLAAAAFAGGFTLLLASAVVPQTQSVEPSHSARVAAVRFAIQNGWKFPSTNVVVSVVFDRGVMHGRPVSNNQGRANAEIAKLLGPDVKAEFPNKYLDCATDRGPCWAKGEVSVLEIGEMLTDSTDVLLTFYAASAKPGEPSSSTSAIIEMEKRGSGWVGTRYKMGPTTRTRPKR